MSKPFRLRGEMVEVLLPGDRREMLRALPEFLEGIAYDDGGPAWSTDRQVAHPGDPGAERRYRELTGAMLDDARRTDRRVFLESLDRDLLTVIEAEVWLRVLGDARLGLAARLGIEEDGWEQTMSPEPVEHAMLQLLGVLQETLVSELASAV